MTGYLELMKRAEASAKEATKAKKPLGPSGRPSRSRTSPPPAPGLPTVPMNAACSSPGGSRRSGWASSYGRTRRRDSTAPGRWPCIVWTKAAEREARDEGAADREGSSGFGNHSRPSGPAHPAAGEDPDQKGGVRKAMTEAIQEMWRESERKDRERKRRRHAAEWYGFYSHLADSHARISQEFERRAEALLEEPGGAKR